MSTARLPSVWRMGVEPWIDPGGATVEAIVEVIKACPSGALSYTIGGEERCDLELEPLKAATNMATCITPQMASR